ncbi:hypothetical protein N7452_000742 [Penicillium brevicompactum]|uniref:Uncharacterized protein n=1 Tax=Penicillium brevicompactum TaxID=5074 RepID=A0A9W9R129_PENBR|nr:hypothetical protein N7452_000742 [Penicillium brevicompactum]
MLLGANIEGDLKTVCFGGEIILALLRSSKSIRRWHHLPQAHPSMASSSTSPSVDGILLHKSIRRWHPLPQVHPSMASSTSPSSGDHIQFNQSTVYHFIMPGTSRGGKKRSGLGKKGLRRRVKETAREDATWSHYRGDLKTACFGGKSQSSLGSLTDESIPPPNLTSHYSAPATGQASASAQSTHPLSHSFTSLHHLITFRDEIPLFLSCQVWSSGAPCEVQSLRFFHVYYYLSPISAVCIDEML